MGDKSHPILWRLIHIYLNELSSPMRFCVYDNDVSSVLYDIDIKGEYNLALVNTYDHIPINVEKKSCLCEDYHVFIKFTI